MSAINKMIKILKDANEAEGGTYLLEELIKEARRLALEESKEKPPAPASLVEELAAIEHEQWMAWAMSISATEVISQERIDRWKKCLVPYAELTEQMKEFDRIWARKSADIISHYRPASQVDIVGDLRHLIKEDYADWRERVDEIIRKYEEGK